MGRKNISDLHTEIQMFHDVGLYVPTRTIYLGTDWTPDDVDNGCDYRMADRFVKNMLILESDSSEPVTVIMNNIGGDEYHGFAIYDTIRESSCHVTVKVRGHAMSMGSIILQAADKRIMGPMATQMVHYGTWGDNYHAKTAQKWAVEGLRLDEWMEKMYLTKIQERDPKFTLAKVKKMLDHDTFLTAEKSVEIGLADEIG